MNPLAAHFSLAAQDGHTVLTRSSCASYRAKGFQFENSEVQLALSEGFLVKLSQGVTSVEAAKGEALCAGWLRARSGAPFGGRLVPASEPPAGCSPCQRAAWGLLTSRGACALAGLPGTGKTWLLAQFARTARAAGLSVRACAPTGKAASVLSLKLDRYPVETIHRLLNLRPGEVYVEQLLTMDVLLVDESSMIDAELMSYLLSAVAPTTQVIFCGDHRQLPPVGAGWPFRDMVERRLLPVAELVTPQRQSEESGVLRLARAVALGKGATDELASCYPDVRYTPIPSKELDDWSVDYYCQRDPKQTLLLSPVKAAKFDVSTAKLSKAISQRLCPDRIEGTQFAVGDRIIFTVNNRQYGFVNGEMGTLLGYDAQQRVADIVNDHGFLYHLDEYSVPRYADLGYALTVHKAQGSEAEEVCLLLTPRTEFMYSRNLLYTALTRAKTKLVLAGDLNVLKQAALRPEVRYTCLPELVQQPDLCDHILSRVKPANLSDFVGVF